MIQIKRALRKEIKARLSSMDTFSQSSQSNALQNKLLSSDFFKNATSVGVYLSMPSEPSTINIVENLLRKDSGKVCYVPVIQEGDETLKMMRVYDMNDLHSFTRNKMNIPEPNTLYTDKNGNSMIREEAPHNIALDLLVVPGECMII